MWRRVDLVRTDFSEEIMEISYLLPQETWTWRQIYESTHLNARSAALAPRLLGQCSLGIPGFSPPLFTYLYMLWAALCCSPDLPYLYSTDPTPLITVDFPCDPLSLPAFCSFFSTGGSVCYPPAHGLGVTFLRNIGWYKICTAPHPRKRHFS
jgi:hypothetical protein